MIRMCRNINQTKEEQKVALMAQMKKDVGKVHSATTKVSERTQKTEHTEEAQSAARTSQTNVFMYKKADYSR